MLLLRELGNQVYPYSKNDLKKGSLRSRQGIRVKFVSPVSDLEYVVVFSPNFEDYEKLLQNFDIPKSVTGNVKLIGTMVECGFYARPLTGRYTGYSFDLQAVPDFSTVLSTVTSITRDFIAIRKPSYFTFSGENERNRQRVYKNVLVPQLAKITNYTYLGEVKKETQLYFVFMKNKG